VTDRQRTSDAHLTPETLAEYLDAVPNPRLPRDRVELHLAECEDCYELFSESVKLTHTLASTAPLAGEKVGRRFSAMRGRRVAVMGSLLATAAAVWLVVSPPAAIVRWWDPAARPELREIVRAVGSRRAVEGRLSGGFAWGPVPSATRGVAGTADTPEMQIAAARLAQAAASRRDARTLAALGVARLASGDLDQSIAHLEEAVALDQRSAYAWSDLSAAYLARATRPGSAADVPRALEAAERALAADPKVVEAQFNKALALERLGRASLAADAWRAYLRLDSASPWASEARTRLADLEKASPRTSAVQDLQAPRERLFDAVLPRWANSVLAGDGGADAALADAIAASDRLSKGSSDRLAADVVAHARAGAGARALLRGHVAYGRARELYVSRQYGAAAREFDLAMADLDRAGSPLLESARLYRAIVRYLEPQLDAAERDLRALLPLVRTRAYSSLAGRAGWVLGLVLTQRGEYYEPADYYKTALADFEAAAEPGQVAFMRQLLADNEERRGQPERSWENRLAALSGTDREGPLLQSAQAALRMNWPHVAAALQENAASIARSANRPLTLVDALRVQALTYVAIGRAADARRVLDEARQLLAQGRVDRPEGLRAELDLVEAKIEDPANPSAGIEAASRASGYFSSAKLTRRLPDVLVTRARLYRRSGDSPRARQDLDRALDLLTKERDALPEGVERLSFAENVRRAAMEFVSLEASSGRPEQALIAADRIRSWDLRLAASAAETMDVRRFRERLKPGVSILYYSIGDTESFAWVLRRTELSIHRLDAGRSTLQALVDAALAEPIASPSMARIGELVVAPVSVALNGATEIVVVPDGPLHGVPFAALPGQRSRYFIQEHTLSYSPSLSAIAATASRLQSLGAEVRTIAAVGNPSLDPRVFANLPHLGGAEREARDVAAVYPESHVLTAENATTETVLDALRTADVLHFGGHGIVNAAYPELSQLGLLNRHAQPLTADAIARLTWPRLRLAVLAACQGLGERSARAQGPMSLARAFLQAGVPTVVANRWVVDDRASIQIATRFHRDYRTGGNAAAALRSAQLAFIDSTDSSLRSPSVWAGWTVIGAVPGLDVTTLPPMKEKS
jgi:tetratricopeptide (TPR) repeat protein